MSDKVYVVHGETGPAGAGGGGMSRQQAEEWLSRRAWGIAWEDANGVHVREDPWGIIFVTGDVLWGIVRYARKGIV